MIKFEDCIKGKGKNIEVDWNVFKKIEEGRNTELYKDVTSSLINLGVLSLKSMENYGLIGEGLLLNPKDSVFDLYFTSKEDAIEYAKNYDESNYSVKPIKLLI